MKSLQMVLNLFLTISCFVFTAKSTEIVGDIAINDMFFPESNIINTSYPIWTMYKSSRGGWIIPYSRRNSSIDADFLGNALESLSVKTGRAVEFQETTDVSAFPYRIVITQDGTGCWSYLGFTGLEEQLMNLDPFCMETFIIEHEFLHALGIGHENNRADRDDFVTFHKDRTLPGFEGAFAKDSTFFQNTPYDYNSLMHSHSASYSSNSIVPTLTHVNGSRILMGNTRGVTAYDVQDVIELYGMALLPPCEYIGALNDVGYNITIHEHDMNTFRHRATKKIWKLHLGNFEKETNKTSISNKEASQKKNWENNFHIVIEVNVADSLYRFIGKKINQNVGYSMETPKSKWTTYSNGTIQLMIPHDVSNKSIIAFTNNNLCSGFLNVETKLRPETVRVYPQHNSKSKFLITN